MRIQFEGIYERDMDLLFMRKFANDKDFIIRHFLSTEELAEKGYKDADFVVESIAHSVMTEDGESDIEVVLSTNGKRVALLIEDKIDAVAMPEQAARYQKRGKKAIERGAYNEFHVFIIAPEDYLKSNAEAKKYPNFIPYENIQAELNDEFDKAMIRHAVSDANNVRLPRDAKVTAFWNKLYDFLDENYSDVFQVHGHRGLERSGRAGQWISMSCNKPYSIEIKSDRGYVDLEIEGYSESFSQFSKDNKVLIDKKRLYIRAASKSLAIRKYVETIDFTQPFESQVPVLKIAFDAAKELQDLIPKLIIR